MLFPGHNDYHGRHAGEYVPGPSPWRRLLVILAVAGALLLLAWPFLEPLLPQVESTVLICADLPPNVGQLRIVYVSDIHAGPFLGQGRVNDLVNRINELDPDIVLLGGDYAENSAASVEFFRTMPSIYARYGVFAIPGNHDRTVPESNLTQLRASMQAAGVTPLINTAAQVRIGNERIWIVGLDDVNCGRPDLAGVAAQVRRDDFVIFLCHSPAIIPQALEARDADFRLGWFDLGLFGHTHGGQVNLFGGLVRDDSVPEAYRSGWTRANRVPLLTSRGYGTTVLPIRILCRPQIHLITLKPAD